MRKRFFWNNLWRTLSFAILPILLLSVAHFFLSYQDLRSNTNRDTLDKLVLMQESITLMLEDSTKVRNFLANQQLLNSIKKTFLQSKLSYNEYLTFQHVVQYLQSFVKNSDYIDSVYVYLPNSQGRYLTSNANIYSTDKAPDQNWLATCTANPSARFIRRQAALYPTLPNTTDYLTVVERGPNGLLVAINIRVTQFKRVLGNSNLTPGQTILIVNNQNELLLSSGPRDTGEQLLKKINQLPQPAKSTFNTSKFLILRSSSEKLGLHFISAMPNHLVYHYLNRFIGLSLMVGAVCLLLCIVFAYISASRNTKQVYFIMELLDAAAHNQPLPTIPQSSQDDIYSYIITNIVQTFIQNNYLKTLLNERKFHNISLELSALQYQINPHFLSNTLQVIDFEVMRLTGKPTQANRMIGQLSEFLQYSLRSPKNDVSLAEEINATKLYIELMKGRYPRNFEVSWQIDDKVLTLPVPKLILQPIIENSIQHCMQMTKTPALLEIFMALQEDWLIISIRDNGPGVSSERLQEIRQSLSHFEGFNQKHIGLQNIFRRLQLRFNMNCKIQLESALNQGFLVTLYIPATNPDSEESAPLTSPESSAQQA